MNIEDFKEKRRGIRGSRIDYRAIESVADQLTALYEAGWTIDIARRSHLIMKRGKPGSLGVSRAKAAPAPFEHMLYDVGLSTPLNDIEVSLTIYSLKDMDPQVAPDLALTKEVIHLYELPYITYNVVGNDRFYQRLNSDPKMTARQLYDQLCREVGTNFRRIFDRYEAMGLDAQFCGDGIFYNDEYMELTADSVDPDKVLATHSDHEERPLDYVGYQYSITVTADRVPEVAKILTN